MSVKSDRKKQWLIDNLAIMNSFHTYCEQQRRWRQQTVPAHVSSCGIYSSNLGSLFTKWVIKQERKRRSFSVIAMCLTDIISVETTCGTPAIEMQIQGWGGSSVVAIISIFLTLKREDWTVWYNRHPAVCSPQEQWSDPEQQGRAGAIPFTKTP